MAQEYKSTDVLIVDLRDELENGQTLRYTGDDTGYTAVMKNKHNKYEYICDLDPSEYFSTFEELFNHLEDIDEIEGWEIDEPPSEEEMIPFKTLKACIYFGDEKGAQLIIGQWMLGRLKARHDVGLSDLSNIVTNLFFEVGKRGKKLYTPEWRLEYMHLELEGEHEKADRLLNAKIAEGMSLASAAISELLYKNFERKGWKEDLPPLPPGIQNPLAGLLNELEKQNGETDSHEGEGED